MWWRERYCKDDWLRVGRLISINSASAVIGLLMVIFSKTYIVQEVTCENSTTIIIKSCDSADKLFTQKILIKTVS